MESYSKADWLGRGAHAVKYAVVIERAEHTYAAYVPDLPGCIATGASLEEVKRNIRDAIEMHLEGMREDNVSVPIPQPETMLVEV